MKKFKLINIKNNQEEMIRHLTMNGYEFSYDSNTEVISITEEDESYVKTILQDRLIEWVELNKPIYNILRTETRKYMITELTEICLGNDPFIIAKCQFWYKNSYHDVINISIMKLVARKYLFEKEMVAHKFRTGEEMYNYLCDGYADLYDPNSGTYIFLYNQANSLCKYSISAEQAKQLAERSTKEDEYWGSHFGLGGSIYDYSDAIDLCKEVYNKAPYWVKTNKYLLYNERMEEFDKMRSA